MIIPIQGYCIFPGNSEWLAPKSADTIVNPFTGDKQATENGKVLFNQLCAICHGNKGKGDGIAGVSLQPRPSNLRKEKTQKQSDGAIFWKLNTGRPPMASYQTSLSEDQLWQLVNYIRTFNKN
jgi:mono/diheme cytochrome c family protein